MLLAGRIADCGELRSVEIGKFKASKSTNSGRRSRKLASSGRGSPRHVHSPHCRPATRRTAVGPARHLARGSARGRQDRDGATPRPHGVSPRRRSAARVRVRRSVAAGRGRPAGADRRMAAVPGVVGPGPPPRRRPGEEVELPFDRIGNAERAANPLGRGAHRHTADASAFTV